LALFVLPNDNVDFECPYGMTWHDGSRVTPKPAKAARPAMHGSATATTGECSPCKARAKQAAEHKRKMAEEAAKRKAAGG
jgi:hypothetical protein